MGLLADAGRRSFYLESQLFNFVDGWFVSGHRYF
jgi:hypothetical protein